MTQLIESIKKEIWPYLEREEETEQVNKIKENFEELDYGQYFDLYFMSKGIKTIAYSENFTEEFDSAFANMMNHINEISDQMLLKEVLDFLIWMRYKIGPYSREEDNYKLKVIYEFLKLFNNINSIENFSEKEKLLMSSTLYVQLTETLKNIFNQDELLKFLKIEGKIDKGKDKLTLGDFTKLLNLYEIEETINLKFKNLIDPEFRNKILHSDFEVTDKKIIYSRTKKEKKLDEINSKFKDLGFVVQFYLLIYLRLFSEE